MRRKIISSMGVFSVILISGYAISAYTGGELTDRLLVSNSTDSRITRYENGDVLWPRLHLDNLGQIANNSPTEREIMHPFPNSLSQGAVQDKPYIVSRSSAIFYDASIAKELPELDRIHLEYEWEPNSYGIYPDADRDKIWSLAYARKTLGRAIDAPIILDDESRLINRVWHPELTDQQFQANLEHCLGITLVARNAVPENLLSFYMLGQPLYSLHNIEYKREEVDTDLQRLGEIIRHLDFITVVLYSRASIDFKSWQVRSEVIVEKARQWGKPICIMVMPFRHAHHISPEMRGLLIPDSEWRKMLEWSSVNAEMVAIWNYPESYAKTMPITHVLIAYEIARGIDVASE